MYGRHGTYRRICSDKSINHYSFYRDLIKAIIATIVASPKITIRAIFPPFPSELRDAIDTIPPASIKKAKNAPKDPDEPPLLSTAFINPAAHN